MLVTSETGRLWGPGLRWQSRHQLMLRGVICVTVSISSTRPWQLTQPIPAATCALCGEMGVVGKVVDANPAHRAAALGAFPNRCERLAVPPHGLMAVHAGPRGREVHDGRNLDRGVTVSAIETELADVELVAVRDRLNGTVAHVRVPRGKEVPDARDRERRTEDCPRWRPRSGACSTRGEKFGPTATAPGRWRPVARPRVRHGTVMPHPRAPKEFVGGTRKSSRDRRNRPEL